jgi:hypothetical protein
MTFGIDFLLQLITAAGAGVTVYAAIRADLARLTERSINQHEAINKAHARIDDHLSAHK